jgi:hypothetical protein
MQMTQPVPFQIASHKWVVLIPSRAHPEVTFPETFRTKRQAMDRVRRFMKNQGA